jgi:hypothetical protein
MIAMDLAAQVPKPVVQGLAAVGLLYVTAKLFSLVRVLSSLFILPGIPVCGIVFNPIDLLYKEEGLT